MAPSIPRRSRGSARYTRIELEGGPEGFTADNTRGRFYTNLEDKDVTLAIDLATRKIVATWKPACGEDGPRGLRLADAEGILLVACTGKLVSLDLAHDGAALGSLDVGEGIDDFDYSSADHRVHVGAAKAARLTVATLDAHGGLTPDRLGADQARRAQWRGQPRRPRLPRQLQGLRARRRRAVTSRRSGRDQKLPWMPRPCCASPVTGTIATGDG